MCTAVYYRGKNHYFGRTLDLEYHYQEEVVVTPRNYTLAWRCGGGLTSHYAYIGMATMAGEVPLYYDGVNEMGVGVAALRFADYAHYEREQGGTFLCAFEVLPYLLSQGESARACVELLKGIYLADTPFSGDYPTTPLHFLLTDGEENFTVEPLAKGLTIFQNEVGVLTNAPDFAMQMSHYEGYRHLSPAYRSKGAEGLPGNWTSQSRFVRGAYLARHMEEGDHNTFFHLMDSLAVPAGSSITEDGGVTRTIYTSCCDLDTGDYHYITHRQRAIGCVSLREQDLDATTVVRKEL